MVADYIINNFIRHIFRVSASSVYAIDIVRYIPAIQEWIVDKPVVYEKSAINRSKYGTVRVGALEIIKRTLNHKPLAVYDIVEGSGLEERAISKLNVKLTATVQEKQRLLQEEFAKWLSTQQKYIAEIEEIYYERFGSTITRKFSGEHLELSEVAKGIKLYGYQLDAVARIIESDTTLLAHDVGSGKTYVMIVAGMEMRRMGISKRNMYVVPNNIVGQWEHSFYQMYPFAHIKVISPETFKPKVREEVLVNIRDNDYDAIIIAYSCFEMIQVTNDITISLLESKMKKIDKAIRTSGRMGTARLYQRRSHVEKSLTRLKADAEVASKRAIYFEHLNINTLFVDEAHNFKNVKVETSMQYVRGMSHTGSQKAKSLLSKCRSIYANNGGRGVVFATGTPITNSMTDLFVMQQYLQQQELINLDLDSFDNWVSMFAEMVDECEVDVNVNEYRQVTRFAYFHNLPELVGLLGQVVDFHKVNEEDLPDVETSDSNKVVPRSVQQKELIDSIAKRIEAIRNRVVDRREDNMLKVTVDGRKLALDVRLLEEDRAGDDRSKTNVCAENVYSIWLQSRDTLGTQMVFSDIGTPKATFNIYDEMRGLLVDFGIPKHEIGFIHEATNESEKLQLMLDMKKGKIRVLLGSTPKMGIGVNVQDRMVALHHLDVPWRPSDMTQREGRILRQGNENDTVRIYRYITDGTFDAYSWQILESKQRFIAQLLCGNIGIRDSAEIDDTVLSYAEVKALAIGNPLIKERVETYNKVMKLRTLYRQETQHRKELAANMPLEEEMATRLSDKITLAKIDNDRYVREYAAIKGGKTEIGQAIIDAIKDSYAAAKTEETIVMAYQGYEIVVPQQYSLENKVVIIRGKNDYKIEVGDSGVGAIIRVDGFLKAMPEYIAKLTGNLQILESNIKIWKNELLQPTAYSDEIERLTAKLKDLSEKLGVKS